MSQFWLISWALVLAIGWLLPNHYLPWTSFHSDAWCASILLISSTWLVFHQKSAVSWDRMSLWLLPILLVPSLQYAFGLIDFWGQVVIVTTYMIGLLLAILTGARWHQSYPDQVIDGLFLAICVASVISVFLQLQTWLNLAETGILDIWSMGLSGQRPYANLGQPNQLATLLLWGLLGSAWAYNRLLIGATTAVVVSAFILTGVALTQSRTAWIALTFLMVCSAGWRGTWRSKSFPFAALALFVYFVVCYFYLHSLSFWLGVNGEDGHVRINPDGELRLSAWRMFADAALNRPWFGYGWSELGQVQLEVAQNYPSLHAVFGHSHNVLLDLILWIGIPLGMAVFLGLSGWYLGRLRAVRDSRDAILVMFLGVVGLHSMLELPLQYAYFLLPVGIVIGVINQRSSSSLAWNAPRWTMMLLCFLAALLLAGIVRDYFKVESSLRDARFEAARIGVLPIGSPPDVMLLTQLRAHINFMRYNIGEDMPPADLEHMTATARAYPSPGRVYKAAKALILNNRPSEGVALLGKICKISSPEECALIKRVWLDDSKGNKLLAEVSWP